MSLAIFDLDNTLIDRDAAFLRWASELLTRYRLDPDELPWLVAADQYGHVDRPAFFAALRERYGLAEPVATLMDRYHRRLPEHVRIGPAVIAMLHRLRRWGWRIAVATNGYTVQQESKLRRTGLLECVDAVAISEEAGAAKPDRELFDIAARRCGMRLTESTWMIGDCPVRDIAGAAALGLRTVWVHQGREWDASTDPPDFRVTDVATVADVLGRA